MKAEFQEFPGRQVYTDVEREGIPPSDADRRPVAPRAVQEKEDRTSTCDSSDTHVATCDSDQPRGIGENLVPSHFQSSASLPKSELVHAVCKVCERSSLSTH